MKTLILGDLCPKDGNFEYFKKLDIDTLFNDTQDMFKNKDLVFANLECAITESENAIPKFGPNLKAPYETALVAKKVGINLLGFSNNHIFDFGKEGMRDTFKAVKEAGLDYTGFGDNYEDSRKNYYFEKNGEKIAVVTVCEHEYTYALENRMGARPFDEYDTLDDVREAKANADRVIVIYHGGKEFCQYPSPRVRKLCHAMAKHGADIIVGQHSHCITCYEYVHDCHIIYGQGNFHFVTENPRDMWHTALMIEYDTTSHEIKFTPTRTVDYVGIGLAKGEDKENIMREFEERSKSLLDGTWRQGWHDFCMSENYYLDVIRKAGDEDLKEHVNLIFGHYLDCEAHTDVWREYYPTFNQTTEVD